MSQHPEQAELPEDNHRPPTSFGDRLAFTIVKILRWFADQFFSGRYGHRAIVLETVAGVPGMVGGVLQHLGSLRRMNNDRGWIKTLLDEAENERMHLMAFIELVKPTWFERFLVVVVQGVFFNVYFLLYLFSPRIAHRIVGYMEEEAVVSYTEYLHEIDAGKIENVPAPKMAIDYWKLESDATLRELIIAIREDEMNHRDVNHGFADQMIKAA